MSVFDFINVLLELIVEVMKFLTGMTLDNMPIFCDSYVAVKGLSLKSACFTIVVMSFERFYATYYPIKDLQKFIKCYFQCNMIIVFLFFGSTFQQI